MISYVKSRPKDSLYRRPIIATNRHTCSVKNSYVGWKRSICSVKRLSPLGKGATYSNEIFARGAAPHPARCPLDPARGSAPWNPVSIIHIQLYIWLYERALRTTL